MSAIPVTEISLRLKSTRQTHDKLVAEAGKSGKPLDVYTSELLEREAKRQSVDEMLAPFRKQVAESGMSDEQFDAFFEGVR
jgi:hypothetical protein